MADSNPIKLCECGCGLPTTLAKRSRKPYRYRHGHSNVVPIEKRFWEKVKKASNDECWLWLGGKTYGGYGVIGSGGRHGLIRAHRLSWEIANSKIPEGLWVLHKCDNPPCVNPKHLFLGTQSDNMNDCIAKGRQPNYRKSHCVNGHEYTEENTYTRPRDGARMCRICTRLSIREHYRRSKVCQ